MKVIKRFLLVVFITFVVINVSACQLNSQNNKQEDKQQEIYKLAQSSGFDGTYEEWLETIKGIDGTSITNVNINLEGDLLVTLSTGRVINCGKVKGEQGESGKGILSIEKTSSNGLVDTYTITFTDNTTSTFTVTNGSTPYIGDNGNWFINDLDTGYKACTSSLPYVVTFDPNNGESLFHKILYQAAKITIPNNPTKVGHTFLGWYNEVDKLWNFETDEVIKNTILTAKYQVNSYTYSYNDGTNSINNTIEYGSNINLPTLTKEGFTFIHWVDEENQEVSNNYIYTKDKTFTPIFKKNITLSFTNVENEIENITTYQDAILSNLPTPTKENYYFAGWYVNDNIVKNGDIVSFDTDITLTAKWSLVQEDFAYAISSDNTIELVKYLGTSKNVQIPTLINDTNVTTILTECFKGNTTIEKVDFSNNIAKISNNAFEGCTSLKEVIFNSGIITYGDSLFKDCTSLEKISIDCIHKDLLTLFDGTDESIPNTFNTIEFLGNIEYANTYKLFQITNKLFNIIINNNITSINNNAFRGCNNLKTIQIPESVTTIGSYAFSECSKLESIVIPNSVKTIGEWAFSDCTKLGYVSLPNGLDTIKTHTFDRCRNLLSISIPASVTKIEDDAFLYCSKLVEVFNFSKLSITKNSYGNHGRIAENALVIYKNSNITSKIIQKDDYMFFKNNDYYYLMSYLGNDTELILPSSLDSSNYSIYSNAFSYNKDLKSVVIPDCVKRIGDYAFAGCISLTNITIPSNVARIGVRAFSICSNLSSITIEENSCLEDIGDYAFEYCVRLKSITIPKSYNLREDSSLFVGCSAFENVYYDGTIDDFFNILINGRIMAANYTDYDIHLYVKNNYNEYYEPNELIIPNFITSLYSFAFCVFHNLKSIIIPASVTRIDYHTFWGCENVIFYCEAASKPEGWEDKWNHGLPVVWGHNKE